MIEIKPNNKFTSNHQMRKAILEKKKLIILIKINISKFRG